MEILKKNLIGNFTAFCLPEKSSEKKQMVDVWCGDYNTVLSSRLNRLDFLYGCDRKIECFSPTAWVVVTADWRQTYLVESRK